MPRVLALWESIRTTYWALPSLMTLVAVGLSIGMIRLDEVVTEQRLGALPWVYAGGAEGARAVLSTIAGSMITVAGVAFSITIVALTLASQQFGPRLLRTFLRDLGNQIVLGTFVATFTYCLLVLRTVRGTDGETFVPHLAVTTGVVLALVSLGVLIFFIHHVSASIQASQIIANVAGDLEAAINRLFPESVDERPWAAPGAGVPDQEGDAVRSQAGGYVRAIDLDGLLALASELDLTLRVEAAPGAFVRRGTRLVSAWPPARVGDGEESRVRGAFILGATRTPTQDIGFFIGQLVELAVRALSPGVNDPGTARTCVDRLEEALCLIAGRRLPDERRHDTGGALRLVVPAVTFASIADSAFDEIRRYGRSSVSVRARLLDAVASIGACVRREEDRQALVGHATLIADSPTDVPFDAADRAMLDARYRAARAVLDAAPGVRRG